MKGCLSDAALYEVYAGDRDPGQLDHLSACLSCTQRYSQLAHRLGAIEHTLRQSPPRFDPHTVSESSHYRYQLPVAATAVAALLLLTWGFFRYKETLIEVRPQSANQDVTRFLTAEVPSALFARVEVTELQPPPAISDAAYIEAALTDNWPCEYNDEGRTIACEVHPFPLLVEDN